MTVAKLTSFIKSSKALKQPDAQVAEVLKSCRMTERLDDATIEELQILGAGPRLSQGRYLDGQADLFPAARRIQAENA